MHENNVFLYEQQTDSPEKSLNYSVYFKLLVLLQQRSLMQTYSRSVICFPARCQVFFDNTI